MNAAHTNCPRCGSKSDTGNNRLVTDSCGHIKCRRCFLSDEQCLECKEKMLETSKSAPQKNINEKTENSKKIKIKKRPMTMPAHIQQVPTSNSGEIQFHCSNCGKSFRSRSQRYYHLACGNESAKKYKCTHCERCFGSRSHLNYHLESHAAQVHRCTQCEMTFKNQRILQKHQKLHETAPISCPECGKLFRCKEYLAPHLKVHRNNLSFECGVCGRKYALKSALKQHMAKHLEKKYVCSHCGKRFQRNSTLKVHIRRHTKTERFACKTCLKNFTDADALKRHAKIHEGAVVKYKCTHCDIISVRKDNMLRHVRNMHLGENFKECVEILREHDDVPTTSAQTVSILDAPNETDTSEEEEEEEEGKYCDKEHVITQQLPKAVENSSVIRCIGNVEPVRIPNTNLNNMISKKEQTQVDAIFVNLENFNFSYDPIEQYRKILMSDDEQAVHAGSQREPNITTIELLPAETNAKDMQQQSTETTITRSRSKMHWRKNFKYTYQYQDY